MAELVNKISNAAGIGGAAACVLAVLLRLSGEHYLLDTELAQWLVGGIALLLIGCFAKLWSLEATLQSGGLTSVRPPPPASRTE